MAASTGPDAGAYSGTPGGYSGDSAQPAHDPQSPKAGNHGGVLLLVAGGGMLLSVGLPFISVNVQRPLFGGSSSATMTLFDLATNSNLQFMASLTGLIAIAALIGGGTRVAGKITGIAFRVWALAVGAGGLLLALELLREKDQLMSSLGASFFGIDTNFGPGFYLWVLGSLAALGAAYLGLVHSH